MLRTILTQLMLLAAFWLAAPAHADSKTQVTGPSSCSTYMGKAMLNELRIGASGTSSTNNQIELFNSGNVPQAVWQTWQLVVYYKKSGDSAKKKGGYYLSSGFSANGQFIYNNNKSLYLRNKNSRSLDVALVDSSGKLIDYLAVENTIMRMPSCFGSTKVVNATASDDRSGNIARLPDGGTWPTSVSNTSGHTISRTNVCTSGSDLVVSNSAGTTNPIVNTTPVSFTVTVQNKSCTNTLSPITITDTGISTGKFSGLSYSPGQGSVSQGANALTWNVGSLAAGANASLTVTGTPTALGTINTTAAVTTPSSGLANTGDDSASANLTVRDFNYVDFDVTTDTVTEGEVSGYSAAISSGIVSSQPITVYYTVSGTAGSGDTDLSASGSVVIDPSSPDSPNQASIDFNITDDNSHEPMKNIVLTITRVGSDDPAVRLGTDSRMDITLQDDDAIVVAHYKFDDSWSATGPLDDSSGNGKHATLTGTVAQEASPASGGKPSTCSAGNFNKAGWFTTASNLNVDTTANGKNSVSLWMYWDGGFSSSNFTMPFSWAGTYYDLTVSKYRSEMGNGVIGFNTGNGDVYGTSADGLANGWHHVAAVFNNGDITQNKLYIDGEPMSLSSYGSHSTRSATTAAGIGAGAGWGGGYKWSGKLDGIKVYNGKITEAQIQTDMAESCVSPINAPAALNAVDTGGGAMSGRIGTKIAGTGFTLDVYALNAAKTAQDSTYAGTLLVDLLANTHAGTALDAQNCPTSSTALSVGTVALSGGKGTLSVPAQANSWRDVRVRLRYPATGTATVTACSSDNFAVKPASLSAQASDADWGSTGTARVLNASSATGTPIHKAGRPFTLTVSGYNSAAGVTGNYNGSPGVASLSALSPATSAGTLSPGAFSGSGGTVVSGTATYSDVGSASVQFQDTSYGAVDAGDTAASCAGYYVCSGTITIGRFVPDHFAVSSASASPACGGFSYFGQDGLGTSFTLTAQNANNGTTANYSETLARLDLSSYAALGFSATGLPATVSFGSGASLPSGSWVGGIAANVRASHLLPRPASAIAPASVALFAAPTDLDGITIAAPAALGSASEFRYGRVRLMNAHGSELLDLPMSLKSEYWAGTASGWTFNSGDTCTGTTLALAAVGTRDITAGTCVRDGQAVSGRACSGTPAGGKQFKEAGVAGFAGDFNLWLKAPGIAGAVDVTATVPAWLQYNWSGSVGNPRARATFGVYKAGPVIYLRENF